MAFVNGLDGRVTARLAGKQHPSDFRMIAHHAFCREYSRLFGAPPQQDVRRMRLAG
jgi:hypothetical protein